MKTNVLFPTTYGKTRFENMNEVRNQVKTNPDALGLFSQCSIYGAGVKKRGSDALDGIFEAANKDCSDAVLCLGRIYEYGLDFIRRDAEMALELYKYAYSLKNIDALHSLGYAYYRFFDKKEIGISMMKKSADLGSRGARFHLDLLKDKIADIEVKKFDDIPSDCFKFDEQKVNEGITLYNIDLEDEEAISKALLEIMNGMPPQTFSVIMNEFRFKYLRGRDIAVFSNIDFRGAFDLLVEEGEIETAGISNFGITEDTLYIARQSRGKMKTIVLDDEDWDL